MQSDLIFSLFRKGGGEGEEGEGEEGEGEGEGEEGEEGEEGKREGERLIWWGMGGVFLAGLGKGNKLIGCFAGWRMGEDSNRVWEGDLYSN
jgi:hypothetical protein